MPTSKTVDCPVKKTACKYNEQGKCTMPDPKKNCKDYVEPYTGEVVIKFD